MKSVPFYDLKVTDGFWAERQKTNIETTVYAVYDRFKETGRISTMNCKAGDITPHCFWASDVFKWIEGAAYILEQKEDKELLRMINDIVDDVAEGVSADGYYSSYYNSPLIEGERFTERSMHELYTLGHMFEAGVALHHATGDTKLLKICKNAADLVYRIFKEEDSAAFVTPGHEEIELALIRLYRETGDKRYLELSEFFVKQRGANDKDTHIAKGEPTYDQAHLPVTEQTEAVGHSVRAVYLCCAVADLAKEKGDKALFDAADRLFTDIYENKMYITGSIGSIASGESFSKSYHLPNFSAYAETCAALGLALFCRRMYEIKPDERYGDAAERAIFNGMISGLSLSGDSFFYVNPLEIDLERQKIPRTRPQLTERVKIFGCSCCPPNLVRFIPSVADLIYTFDDNNLYVHQYIANEGKADGAAVSMKTLYPADGRVRIEYNGNKKLVLRRPSWCNEIKTGESYTERDGYLYFNTNKVEIEFVMTPVFYQSSDKVHENTGRVCLMRGPIVYCIEEQDQSHPIFNLRVDTSVSACVTSETFGGYPVILTKGEAAPSQKALYSPCTNETNTPCDIKFIPYYAFANRGADNMMVWVMKK